VKTFLRNYAKGVDKSPFVWYNINVKKERYSLMKKTYNFWKSIYTGHITPQEVEYMPKFGGWELVSEQTYEEYLKANPNIPDLRD
jgi:hypothetical protein